MSNSWALQLSLRLDLNTSYNVFTSATILCGFRNDSMYVRFRAFFYSVRNISIVQTQLIRLAASSTGRGLPRPDAMCRVHESR